MSYVRRMAKRKIGRIIDFWSEGETDWVEFLVESNREVLQVSKNAFRHIKKGDLGFFSQPQHFVRVGGSGNDDWSPLGDSLRWRRTTGQPSRMSRLWQRQEVMRTIREDLYTQGFIEVETPLCVKGTCPDTHIESFEIGAPGEGYLVTSTEYQIKRLIVGGFEKVFTLTQNFRAHDRSRYHSSEFTMLEWARMDESLDQIEEDLERLIRKSFHALFPGSDTLVYQGTQIDLLGPWEKITVRDAFKVYLGMDDLLDFSLENLTRAAQKVGIPLPHFSSLDRHGMLSYLLDLLQVHLGKTRPTFLREWPVFMTSSAEVNPQDSTTAQRSELYIAGIEISDGFPFLRDGVDQRKFFQREIQRRKDEGKVQVKLDEKYLQALAEGIPPGAGMALGIDRLVMVLTGATQLAEVQAFSWDEL